MNFASHPIHALLRPLFSRSGSLQPPGADSQTQTLMKQLLKFTLAAVLLALGSATATALPGRAEVKKVTGQATVSKQSGTSQSITVGMVLGAGDTVSTGAGSTVDLDLGINGEFLQVEPDSTLNLDTLEIANVSKREITTRISVPKGTVTGAIANKLSLASKYEIRTPAGVAGIRGTKWRVYVPPGLTLAQAAQNTGRSNFRLIVTEGSVTFTPPGSTTPVTVSAANGAVIYAFNTATGRIETQPLLGAKLVDIMTGADMTVSPSSALTVTSSINRAAEGSKAGVLGGTVITGSSSNPLNVSTSGN